VRAISLALSGMAFAGQNDGDGDITINGGIKRNTVTLGGAHQGQLQGQAREQGIVVNFGGEGGPAAQGGSADAQGGQGGEANSQGQSKSQSFSNSSSSSNSNSSSDNNLELTFEDERQFAPTLQAYGVGAGQVRYAPNNYDKARGYIPLKTFVMLKGDIEMPEGVLESRHIGRDITFFEDADRSNYAKSVKLWLEAPEGVQAVAVGTVWAEDKEDNTTAALVFEGARYCSRMSTENMVVIKQNASSQAVSSGWGVGLSYNMAGMTNGGDISQVGAGGTGYSRAKGGHRYALGLEFACVR